MGVEHDLMDKPVQGSTVTRYTTIKYRIYPTPKQIETIEATFNCCRFLWNQMLADEREFYAATDRHFIPNPGVYKKIYPFLKEADSQALGCVRINLKNAFQCFFKQPEQFHYPLFKKKKSQKNTYSTYCHHYGDRAPDSIRIEDEGIVLPKLKWVKARLHRKPQHWWTLQYAVVSKTKSGKYFCALVYKYSAKTTEPLPVEESTTLGLKYSYQHFYVGSNGDMADPPHWMRESEEKLKKLQRKMARMQPDSKNHQETLQKYRLTAEHIRNQRMDYIHKESRRITNAWDTICVRNDDFRALASSIRYARILDSGFAAFRRCLCYKAERTGKNFAAVEPSAPTTRRCHVCGAIAEEVNRRRKLWECPCCGTVLDREINAAINIKAQGGTQLLLYRESA